MSDKLIDTNIIVYAYDTSEGEKHEASRNLLRQIWKDCIFSSLHLSLDLVAGVAGPSSCAAFNRPICGRWSQLNMQFLYNLKNDMLYRKIQIYCCKKSIRRLLLFYNDLRGI